MVNEIEFNQAMAGTLKALTEFRFVSTAEMTTGSGITNELVPAWMDRDTPPGKPRNNAARIDPGRQHCLYILGQHWSMRNTSGIRSRPADHKPLPQRNEARLLQILVTLSLFWTIEAETGR
jgi:hypothetical protein